MSLAELAVAALVLVIVVGVLVGVTLFTFPAASVLRTLGGALVLVGYDEIKALIG